jgi:hypothetical protein
MKPIITSDNFIWKPLTAKQAVYGVFCMTDRMLANGYKIDALDDFWADAITEYNKFLNSEFNVDSKSELDCIDDYFNNNQFNVCESSAIDRMYMSDQWVQAQRDELG